MRAWISMVVLAILAVGGVSSLRMMGVPTIQSSSFRFWTTNHHNNIQQQRKPTPRRLLYRNPRRVFNTRLPNGSDEVASTTHAISSLVTSNTTATESVADGRPIAFLPSKITFSHVSVQYPVTWTRNLFSSIPHREYALRNVNVTFSSNLCLLIGASSSGKSTILKVVHGDVPTTSGIVEIDSCYDDRNHDTTYDAILASTTTTTNPPRQPIAMNRIAKPVYLDSKPSYDNDKRTLHEILNNDVDLFCRKKLLIADNVEEFNGVIENMIQYMASHVFQLRSLALRCTDLSPSELYRFQLLRACLDSMIFQSTTTTQNTKELAETACTPSQNGNNNYYCLPGPILLLDEWLDTETSEVIHIVQKSMQRVTASMGGMACIVTHKPERFLSTTRTITLCRGEILQDDPASPS